MNNKKQEIQAKLSREKAYLQCTQDTIEQLEKQLNECDVLQLEPFDNYIDVGIQHIFNIPSNSMSMFQHGVCYETKELAEIALNNSNIRNKLEAYSRVIDPDWRECWDGEQNNYFITFEEEKYYQSVEYAYKQLGTTYMSQKAAERIVQALRDKEITI